MTPETHQKFLTFYKPIHERFTRYCSSNAYGLMEAEDLVQDAILATLQHFNRINEKDKLFSYMICVANNLVKNVLRRQKFKGVFNEKAALRLEGNIGNPEVALDIHYLYKALNQLTLKDKEAVILFEVNGFSIREISEMQQSSEGAIKTRLSRARQKLKALLSEDRPQLNTYSKTQVLFSIFL
ncbi:MAG: RNA polymerase sigma factor [Chitinophagales bacterium]